MEYYEEDCINYPLAGDITSTPTNIGGFTSSIEVGKAVDEEIRRELASST